MSLSHFNKLSGDHVMSLVCTSTLKEVSSIKVPISMSITLI